LFGGFRQCWIPCLEPEQDVRVQQQLIPCTP
jgi:hypothetical protein